MKFDTAKQISTVTTKDPDTREDVTLLVYITSGGGIAAIDSSFVGENVVEADLDLETKEKLANQGLEPLAFSPFDIDTLLVCELGNV